MQEYAGICKSMWEYVGTQEYARICGNMKEYAGICGNMQEYVGMCRNARICRICWNIKEYAGMLPKVETVPVHQTLTAGLRQAWTERCVGGDGMGWKKSKG